MEGNRIEKERKRKKKGKQRHLLKCTIAHWQFFWNFFKPDVQSRLKKVELSKIENIKISLFSLIRIFLIEKNIKIDKDVNEERLKF